MLKDLLMQRDLTVYKVSKETGIPYTTLLELSSGKTDMEKANAGLIYRLSKYLGISMEQLYLCNEPNSIVYLYNEGREIFVEFNECKFRYLGPKNLLAFKKVNRICGKTVCADTYFTDEKGKIIIEEEYVDLEDVFKDYAMETIIPANFEVRIGRFNSSIKERLLDEALVISDNMAITYEEDSTGAVNVCVTNVNRVIKKAKFRLQSMELLNTNMSGKMIERARQAVARNRSFILLFIEKEVTGRA